MKKYKYLIVGGGLTGDAAIRGIRESDPEGQIGMISMESDPPYLRPSLSKGLWKGRPIEKIWRNTQKLGVDMHLGRMVNQLDPQNKHILDDKGDEYTYDKLLLATGGTPVRLPFGNDNIIYYRDLEDYQRLRSLSEQGEHFLVIGGGFIGSEIAAALTITGKKAIMIFPEDAIGANIFPNDLSHYLNDFYRQKGVEILSGDSVVSVNRDQKTYQIQTKNGHTLRVDGVVAGIGIRPNIVLAKQAGLQVENGIVVNEHLLTSAHDIYAAGDVANFFHPTLRKRVRVEHEDNAIQMGRLAGRNMAGAREAYMHVPMFYSDLFELGYEAVGELNSNLEIVADWQQPYNIGIVYYLEDSHVRGILLWNIWNKVPAARTLLAEAGPFKPDDLIGRIS